MLGEIVEKIEEIVGILYITLGKLSHISRNIEYFEPHEKTEKANEVYDNLYKIYVKSWELVSLLKENYRELSKIIEDIYIFQLIEFLSDLFVTVEITSMFIKWHIMFAPVEANKQAISALVPRLERFFKALHHLKSVIR